MSDQIDINELRNIFTTSNKKKKKIEYQKKLAKAQEQKAIKDTVSPPKSPEQLLSEQIQEETIKKKAKSIVNPVSKEEIETKALERQTKLKKARKEAKGPTPQEDILRYGQEQKKFRDLAYKERTVEEEDDEGETTVSMQYIPREGNELFKQQVEAYGDSLRLASLAQQYGTRTPDIRKIDKNRNAITQERNELTKKLMSQEFPLVPGPDGTYTRISDEEKMKTSMERANDMLVQKYGKGIIPLLTALANR